MTVGDQKDETQKALHSVNVNSGNFKAAQEKELKRILKNLGFANFRESERMKQFLGIYLGKIVEVTFAAAAAGTEITVAHGLREVPAGYIVVDTPVWNPAVDSDWRGQAVPPLIAKSTTAWTNVNAYFTSNHDAGTLAGGACVYKVLLWIRYTGR